MYVDYDKLLPDVVQILFSEGIEDESFNKNRAIYAIRNAYKEFVRDTHILRRDIVIPTQSCVQDYSLMKYDGHIITKIYSVEVEHQDHEIYVYKKADLCGFHDCYHTYEYDGRFMKIHPEPECDGREIRICVSMMPSSDICLMDERIYELYGEYIAEGAAATLLSAENGVRYRRYYTIGKDIAQADAAEQWSRRDIKDKRLKWRRR